MSSITMNQSVGPMKSFEEWQAKHVFLGEFDINFNGSSPAMEMERAQTLWTNGQTSHEFKSFNKSQT